MGKLDDMLYGVTQLGFDTALLIYFVGRHPDYIAIVREVFRQVDAGSLQGITGMVSFAEVLVVPKRLRDRVLEEAYHDILFGSQNFSTVPIDAGIADRAADLRGRYRLKLPDALQVAAAIETRCEAFLANDAALSSVTDIRVIILKDLEL